MKRKTCCFTGHRVIHEVECDVVRDCTRQAVTTLIEQGITCFIVGGAKGYDTLAAEIVLKLRGEYPHIQLILVVPYAQQTKGWSEEEQRKYQCIKNEADEVKILSEHYYRGCLHARNRHMVDHAACCVCYCKKSTGGTAYTVAYARKRGLQVIEV